MLEFLIMHGIVKLKRQPIVKAIGIPHGTLHGMKMSMRHLQKFVQM
jgi:hypothetical protein